MAVGKEKFDEWINSSIVKYRIDASSFDQLGIVVNNAGYDFVSYLGNYKTHLSDKKDDFFWWSNAENSIVAEFNKNDVRVADVIRRIELTAGKKMFYQYSKRTDNIAGSGELSTKTMTFQTVYTDYNTLTATLNEMGIKYSVSSVNSIYVDFDFVKYHFTRHNSSTHYLLTVEENQKSCETLIQHINSEYQRKVQEAAYMSIVNNCVESNSTIENEEVLEDGSIVLTINV